MRKWLAKLAPFFVIWTILRGVWEAIGHIGNLQTLWDIVAGLVKNWPNIFQYTALIVASWWFPLFWAVVCLTAWLLLARYEKKPKAISLQDPSAPRFETFEPRIEYHEAIKSLGLSIGYENIGQRDAIDVDISIWMSEHSLALDSHLREIKSANDVPPHSKRFVEVNFGITKPEIAPFFVALTISFRSHRERNERTTQRFYYKWFGIRNCITNFTLSIATRDERERIEERIALETQARTEFKDQPVPAAETSHQEVFEVISNLKSLAWEGERMVHRYYLRDLGLPTGDEVENYLERTLDAAKHRALRNEGVTAKQIALLQQPWDESELLLKKAELDDVGTFSSAKLANLAELVSFDRLYSRVQRLWDLLQFIEGVDSRPTPPAVD